MSQITTHVLDTSRGQPAEGIAVNLYWLRNQGQELLGSAQTDADGRANELLDANAKLRQGIYKLNFDLESYFAQTETPAFYPRADIVFHIHDETEHYHVPLLLSPFGYSTYRGS